MVALSKTAHDLGFLKSEFKEVEFELYSCDQLQFINCIVCWFGSSEEMVASWKAIQSIVSVKFKPEAKFSRWNIYLVMLCPDRLEVREKYVIENDRYAARKVVLDNQGERPTIESIEKLINVELLGANLKLQKTLPKLQAGVKLSIASLIKNAPIDATSKSKEKRGEIVNKLIEYYRRDENKES
ncbi:ABC-three component system middle component 1 [Pseudomonas sp. BIC9C]|uniref:ABC-three component system middle component 1 n=1 Tax=Pseudomonas sp. BIC9C TaxID=3078458 RepID=UPI002AD46B7A|nr:ABC-three component system middle component 1 [Pseudomonas sp. BIC9C]